ncbi:MAG: CBS domain-containing protein [Peptococcaceae bacterium]|nr:CBS domain-containing protein [Peptococcaceae bacterium]
MSEIISNIMEKDVYCAREDDTIATVLKKLVDKKISGLPIVDGDDKVVGFISDGDIMKFIAKQDPRIIDMTSFITVWYDSESFDQKMDDLLNINVMELATTKVISAEPDEDVDEVARTLGKKKIKKLPVIDENGKLIGVISRHNIIRYIISYHLKQGE